MNRGPQLPLKKSYESDSSFARTTFSCRHPRHVMKSSSVRVRPCDYDFCLYLSLLSCSFAEFLKWPAQCLETSLAPERPHSTDKVREVDLVRVSCCKQSRLTGIRCGEFLYPTTVDKVPKGRYISAKSKFTADPPSLQQRRYLSANEDFMLTPIVATAQTRMLE